MYSLRKFGLHYQVDLKRLANELLVVTKKVYETFLRSVLQNEDNVGQSYIVMLNDVREIEKIFQR